MRKCIFAALAFSLALALNAEIPSKPYKKPYVHY